MKLDILFFRYKIYIEQKLWLISNYNLIIKCGFILFLYRLV